MIDLHTASAEQLDTVPELRGHGFEIVRYREARGRFETRRQLEEVPGLAGEVARRRGPSQRRLSSSTAALRPWIEVRSLVA
ncbi:helix-hairpin-helix domain-containing protein [Sphingomonas sp. PP-CE-1G-424]|uniref:helix-hairpin-helix domain-containing protein n=1 Tax=Sphingomonas sp. PP-CE-1G-424 TaxID=2135658 RepID=UPI001055F152|nr:helix-hairpin-helix domain-containing protein [Sphingomonas sp. PP-CE-1G-424]TCP66154.1 helix-hairpin-helix protein [Sphingomonas sp. PP-CE-1G-424]